MDCQQSDPKSALRTASSSQVSVMGCHSILRSPSPESRQNPHKGHRVLCLVRVGGCLSDCLCGVSQLDPMRPEMVAASLDALLPFQQAHPSQVCFLVKCAIVDIFLSAFLATPEYCCVTAISARCIRIGETLPGELEFRMLLHDRAHEATAFRL
jgi:hypothetical protein